MLAFWVLAGAISCGLHGFSGVELTGYSLVVCLIPGWLAFIVPAVYRAPAAALAVVVAGMMLRLAFCGAGLWIVSRLHPISGLNRLSGGWWCFIWLRWELRRTFSYVGSGCRLQPECSSGPGTR